LTALADTVHFEIPTDAIAFLIISSDGLENPEFPSIEGSVQPEEQLWVRLVGQMVDSKVEGNLCVKLVRALCGEGEKGRHIASALLTLDHKEDHYQDDTTVLISVLG
jgi:hypothetical protein